MNIAMVSEHASPLAVLGGVDAGGQNVHVACLAQALASRGARIVVHTRRDDPSIDRRVRFGPGVVVDHVDAGPPEPVPKDLLFPYMDRFSDELYALWRKDPPDVVHAHFWMSGYAALRAARMLGIPLVLTFHALGVVKRRHQKEKDTSPPERLAVEEDLLQSVDHVAATSSDEVFELARLGGDTERISVIPCGVDLELFRPDGPVERRNRLRRICVVSRLVERKGIDTVIRAMRCLEDAELVVAGGPAPSELDGDPEAQRLRRIAERSGVADRVRFLGRIDRPRVAALMRSADVVVSTPWYEPFGIVPVEAMASGTPVVVSAVGGQIDTVIDGVTGLHVPPRRSDMLAGAIRSLVDDPPRRTAVGRAGVRRARTRYGWDRVASLTTDLYRSLIGTVSLKEARS